MCRGNLIRKLDSYDKRVAYYLSRSYLFVGIYKSDHDPIEACLASFRIDLKSDYYAFHLFFKMLDKYLEIL